MNIFTTQNSNLLCSMRCLCFGLSCLVVSLTHARPYDDVVESGTLSVFVYSDYAPYSWQEEGEYKGIDVDIARALGKALDVDIDILMRGADENVDDDLRVNVWKGDLIHRKLADVMLHVPYDREVDIRNELAVLMAPYFVEEMAVVVDSEKLPVLETFARFRYHKIAAELDTASDFFLSNAFQGQLQENIDRGRTFGDAATSFWQGEVAAMMASKAQAEWVAKKATDAGMKTRIEQPPMPGIVRDGWSVGIAVRHDSRDLGYALEGALHDLKASGKLAEISARYGVTFRAPEGR